MTINPRTWEITLSRRGDAIVATNGGRPIDCGRPTVETVDLIRGLEEDTNIDLRHGDFAPGATPESDGSSEIEFEYGQGIGGPLRLFFGRKPDHVALGSVGSELAVNLNADEPAPDADITIEASDSGFGIVEPYLDLGAGADTYSAFGGAGFDGPFEPKALVVVIAGPGGDELRGGPSEEVLLGRRGKDLVTAGRGRDAVLVERGGRDDVDCGPGRDFLSFGRKDSARRCERRLRAGKRR